jgi:hypothetical protein
MLLLRKLKSRLGLGWGLSCRGTQQQAVQEKRPLANVQHCPAWGDPVNKKRTSFWRILALVRSRILMNPSNTVDAQ